MNKQKIFLDFDNTIVNATETFVKTYNHDYEDYDEFVPGDPLKVNDYDFADECSLLQEGDKTRIFESVAFFYLLDFIEPNTKDILQKISEKYDVYITTIGTIKNLCRKAQWLDLELPFIKNYILLRNENYEMNKSIVNMHDSIIIDDVSSNLFSSNAKDKYLFGKTYNWNKDWNGLTFKTWDNIDKTFL